MSKFNLLKCSHFLNSFELLGNRKKTTLIYLNSCYVYNQLQNKQESLANANVKRATAVRVRRHMTSIGTTVA